MMIPIPEGISFPVDERIIVSDKNADYCLGLLANGTDICFCVLNTGHKAGTQPSYSRNTPIVMNWSQVPFFIVEMAGLVGKELALGEGALDRIREAGYAVSINRV